LILRVKDDYDGAEPSGNSVATLALLKLAAITGREDFKKPAEATLRLFAHRLQHFPQAMPFMLHALDFSLQEPARRHRWQFRFKTISRTVARRAFGLSAEQNCAWEMPARLRNLRAACREKLKRWFISAPANRASRRPATRRR
jgi:uncharacterized protein YyaL (SSP411 family)